jgi:hypothetical protein
MAEKGRFRMKTKSVYNHRPPIVYP